MSGNDQCTCRLKDCILFTGAVTVSSALHALLMETAAFRAILFLMQVSHLWCDFQVWHGVELFLQVSLAQQKVLLRKFNSLSNACCLCGNRCLGDLPFKGGGKDVVDCTPEMRRIELQPGDSAVVLATDGLWDVMTDTDAVSLIAKARTRNPLKSAQAK